MRRPRFGPGLVVSAAFIGPGTVTTCSLAGMRRGTDLLWALALSVAGTMVLQEAALRVGLISGQGLGEALASRMRRPVARGSLVALVLLGVGVGCAAYQGGNLSGAALGLEAMTGGGFALWVGIIALAAAALLATGSYRPVERVLVVLVVLMGLVFVATAWLVRPSLSELALGLVPGSLQAGDSLLVLALIGTTVVPYNLFLHAAACRERFSGAADLPAARADAFLSIGLGGVVSAAVLVTGAALRGVAREPDGAAGLARQLEPLLGEHALWLFGSGLFAAGMTSAVTAPLAAAYAVSGVLGWPRHGRRFRMVWGVVLAAGFLGALTSVLPAGHPLRLGPLTAITVAQAANGLLLPVVAVLLLVAVNDPRLMGERANGRLANLLAGLFVLLAAVLGGRGILRAVGIG